MKVIFLDIDGVLNGYSWFDHYIRFGSGLNKLLWKYELFHKYRSYFDVKERYVKNLAKIVHKTGAKVVISSSWRYAYIAPENRQKEDIKRLKYLLNKYNIEVIGITPSSKETRGQEIHDWLNSNKDILHVKEFLIIDDEDFDFIQDAVLEKHTLITRDRNKQYRYYCYGPQWNCSTGLKRRYIKRAINILNGNYYGKKKDK